MHAMLHNQAHLPPAYFTNLLPDNVKHGEVIKAFSFLLWIFNLWIISRSLCKWRRLSSQNYKIINQHTLLQVTLCDSFCQLKCFMVPFCPRQKSDLCHWLTSAFTRSPFSTPIRCTHFHSCDNFLDITCTQRNATHLPFVYDRGSVKNNTVAEYYSLF